MLGFSWLCRRSASQIPQLQHQQLLLVFTSQFSSHPARPSIIDFGVPQHKNSPSSLLLLLERKNNNNVLTFPCHRSIHITTPTTVSKDSNYSPTYYYNMSSKHLGPGSTCPPLKDDKLRIYSMRFCPYAQRALLVAIAKEIPHDVVNINLKQKPEWIFPLNPQGKVPTIESKSGNVLYESLIVADYLDDIYPKRPLQSRDPYQRALDRVWIENFGKISSLFYKTATSKDDPEEVKKNLQGIKEALVPFEQELARRGTTFFGGADLPGMLDYMIWPFVERLPVLKLIFPEIYNFEDAKKNNPKLEQWRQAMKEDGTVKEFYLSPEVHLKFMLSHFEGTPNYDLLEE